MPNNYNKRLRLGCIIFPLLVFAKTFANPADVIYLNADSVRYDYKKGVIYYTGNVSARQGLVRVTADEMVVIYNAQHKIEKITAVGNLAHYSTLLNERKNTLDAWGKNIVYFPLVGKVDLIGQGKIKYDQSTFSGSHIIYDIKNQVITSQPQKDSHTEIVLQPMKDLKLTS